MNVGGLLDPAEPTDASLSQTITHKHADVRSAAPSVLHHPAWRVRADYTGTSKYIHALVQLQLYLQLFPVGFMGTKPYSLVVCFSSALSQLNTVSKHLKAFNYTLHGSCVLTVPTVGLGNSA